MSPNKIIEMEQKQLELQYYLLLYNLVYMCVHNKFNLDWRMSEPEVLLIIYNTDLYEHY